MITIPDAPAHEPDLLQHRRDKLTFLQERGVDAFGGKFEITHELSSLRANFTPDLTVKVAGRITSRRDMGKSQFFDLSNIHGRIQCYLNSKEIDAETMEIFHKGLDIGDFIGVDGFTFHTRTGEPSVHVKSLTVLSKSLRPLPEKWHGVTDRETKYRQRYLDLIANEETRRVFLLRSRLLAGIRAYLQERDFLEVETPMMQSIAGGAAARPFVTHMNALNQDVYLRISPELYLKRLLVAGFDKVFEMNRNFRNEGLSRRHNPEFTMLEVYQAFADFEVMADLVEDLTCHLAETFCGGLQIEHKNAEGEVIRTINLAKPWRRASYRELVRGAAGEDWFEISAEERGGRAQELLPEMSLALEDHEITQLIFEKLVEEKTFDPVFVTHMPTELVPLARQNPADSTIVDVYELIINGQEISPGYSELNDPIVQRARLEAQVGEEIHNLDEEFLLALEHGMPPAGGIGIGIDRLVILLSGAESIRDVILFPGLKNKE